MTYIEAVRELQRRSIDTLKVAQAAQLLTLRAARDATIANPAVPVARDVTDWALALSYRMMAQQAAYAKRFVDAFVQPSSVGVPYPPRPVVNALSAPAAADTLAAPAVVETLAAAPAVEILAAPPALEMLSAASAVDVLPEPASDGVLAEPEAVPALVAPEADDALDATGAVDAFEAIVDTLVSPADVVEYAPAASSSSQILTPPFAESAPRELVNERFVPIVSGDGFVAHSNPKLQASADQKARSVKQIRVPAVSSNSMPPKRAPKKNPPKPSHENLF